MAEDINRNVTSIKDITEGSADGASQQLARLADELQTLVGQFKT